MTEDYIAAKRRIPLRTLKKIRKQQRVTQARLAELLDVSTQYVSLLERGKNTLSYHNALKIAAFLDMTPKELFENDFIAADIYLAKKRG